MQLQDHCLIITDMMGLAGSSMAHAFAAAGANIVFGGQQSEPGHKLQELLEATGSSSLFIEVNPADESSVQSFISDAIMTFGRLDGVVLNHPTASGKGEQESLEEALASDLLAARYAAPFLSASPHGSVVLIGPGKMSAPMQTHTSELAKLWAPQGVRVNSIVAGQMMSSLERDTPEHIQAAVQAIPLSRLATHDDITQPCAFLLSTESSYITGALLHSDGGASLG